MTPGDESWLTRLLARVESIPVSTLEAGLEYRWRTYAEFLDVVDAAAARSEHRLPRRPLGDPPRGDGRGGVVGRGDTGAARGDARRCSTTRIAAGGFGFSTANAATQVDGDGRPTPPNFATRDEFVALAAVCGRHPGPSIEFIPDSFLSGFTDDDVELMADMSAAANRVLNWNKPLVNKQLPDLHRRQLRACDVAIERGGRVVPMMTPQNGLIQHDFEPGYVFRALPGWGWLFELAPADRRAALGEPRPASRGSSSRWPRPPPGLALVVRNWSSYVVNEVHDPRDAELVGRRIDDLAASGA